MQLLVLELMIPRIFIKCNPGNVSLLIITLEFKAPSRDSVCDRANDVSLAIHRGLVQA